MIGFMGIWDNLLAKADSRYRPQSREMESAQAGATRGEGVDRWAKGGLMVCGMNGDPLEFAVATPVRPHGMQCAIWGDRIRPHVVSNLIATPLIDFIKKKPRVVLTNHLCALEALPSVPLAHMNDAPTPPRPELPHIANIGKDRNLCLSTSCDRDEDDLEIIHEILNDIDPNFNPVSAFDRIHRAMGALANVDTRYA